MLGFRGAARYVHPAYAEAFALECAALKKVRETMGLTNLKVRRRRCERFGSFGWLFSSLLCGGDVA